MIGKLGSGCNALAKKLVLAVPTALVLALLLVLPNLFITDGGAGAPNTCDADVYVIGVRGSGQEKGEGDIVSSFRRSLTSRADKGVVTSMGGLNYPAIPIRPNLDEVGDLLRTFGFALRPQYALRALKKFLNRYRDSVNAGVARLVAAVQSRVQRCPSQKLVLAGYSQGAQVVHRAIQAHLKPLANQVGAVVLFGDPMFDSRMRGTFGFGSGLFSSDPRFPPAFEHVGSWCLPKDPVCSGTFRKLNPHFKYEVRGVTRKAASLTARWLGLARTRLAFVHRDNNTNDGPDNIFTSDIFGDNIMRLTETDDWLGSPSFSFDGKQIAYDDSDGGSIWVMSAEGTKKKRLTTPSRDWLDTSPSFFPDGRIVFYRDYGAPGELWVMDGDGSNLHQLTAFTQDQQTPMRFTGGSPVVSPDGRHIAFNLVTISYHFVDLEARMCYVENVAVANSNGSNLRLISRGSSPTFFPSGTRVAFTWHPPSGDPLCSEWGLGSTSYDRIAAANIDGSGFAQIVTPPEKRSAEDPTLTPDGRTIVFEVSSRLWAASLESGDVSPLEMPTFDVASAWDPATRPPPPCQQTEAGPQPRCPPSTSFR